jgi:hypothetical protein
MKKTVKPKGPAKPVQARADQSIQDKNLPSQEPIQDNKGLIPVETENFKEKLVNEIPTKNDDKDMGDGGEANREMMDIIRNQNTLIAQMQQQQADMEARISDTLKPKIEPGKHTTWSYRYAVLPSEGPNGDGVIVSWRTKKWANVIDKTNFVTITAKYFDGKDFIDKEHDIPVAEFSRVIARSEPIEAKALFNEVYDERGKLVEGQKGDSVSKVKKIDPVSGTLILMIQPEYQNYYVVLPIKEFAGQNFMFNTRFLNV